MGADTSRIERQRNDAWRERDEARQDLQNSNAKIDSQKEEMRRMEEKIANAKREKQAKEEKIKQLAGKLTETTKTIEVQVAPIQRIIKIIISLANQARV